MIDAFPLDLPFHIIARNISNYGPAQTPMLLHPDKEKKKELDTRGARLNLSGKGVRRDDWAPEYSFINYYLINDNPLWVSARIA